jgi:CRP-like cAMP-binding protein
MSNPLQLSIVTFPKGAYITVEGKQNADQFYIVRSGKVQVSKEVQVVSEEGGNILNPGDFFGVISTMSGHSHIETAQALTDVSLIAVHREKFDLLIERNTPVAMKIIELFSRQLRHFDEALARLTQKTIKAENDVSHLFRIGEFYVKQNQFSLAYYCYHQYLKNCPDGENVTKAKERMAKIKPYAKPVYLDGDDKNFNRVYPKDTMIFAENMPGKELYIIQKGSIKITKMQNDNEMVLAVLKAGDIFGEMSLIENKPRSASAIAIDEATLLAVNRENFENMIKTQPAIINRLTTTAAKRLWLMYKQLANTLITDPIGKLWDYLMIQVENNKVEIKRGTPFTFNFGVRELGPMVGLPPATGNTAVMELLKNSIIKNIDNKLHCTDVDGLVKQASYYRKMQKIELARRDNKR